jgi:hypothetical protein
MRNRAQEGYDGMVGMTGWNEGVATKKDISWAYLGLESEGKKKKEGLIWLFSNSINKMDHNTSLVW